MRNVLRRTAAVCCAFVLLQQAPSKAQDIAATPEELSRARDALRAGLDDASPQPSAFDPQSARIWKIEPATNIAPGRHANLFEPSTETLNVPGEGEWLADSVSTAPERAATQNTPPKIEPDEVQDPALARAAEDSHAKVRSGRASAKGPAPVKAVKAKARVRPERAPGAPMIGLPDALQP
jgi:hypothetical protein